MGNRDHLVDKIIIDKNGHARRTKVLPNGAVPSPGNVSVASVAPVSASPSRGAETKSQFSALGGGETDEQFINMLEANGNINVLAANHGLLPLQDRNVELTKDGDRWKVDLSLSNNGERSETGFGKTPVEAYHYALGTYLDLAPDDFESAIVLARINEWDTEDDSEAEVKNGEIHAVDLGDIDEYGQVDDNLDFDAADEEHIIDTAITGAERNTGWAIKDLDLWVVSSTQIKNPFRLSEQEPST